MVQIEVTEGAAKMIEAVKCSGYGHDVKMLALRLMRNVKLLDNGVLEDAHDADLLTAAQWLAEYADVLDALDE